MFPSKRVLVTGGAGFVGVHVVTALLAAGWSVCVLDDLSTGRRDRVPEAVGFVLGSVVDADLVRRLVASVDCVVHLAAIASVQRCNEEWAASHAVNLTGTVNVFDAASRPRAGGARTVPVVYASSAAVYGDSGGLPARVEDVASPVSFYGADKLACELHAKAAARVFGLSSVGLRFFNVYGPGQDPSSPYSGVMTLFADRLLSCSRVTVYGDGAQTRDFVSVADVAGVVVAAAERLLSHADPDGRAVVLNVGTGVETSVLGLLMALGRALSVVPLVDHVPARPGEVRRSASDQVGLLAFLPDWPGWRPLDEGLALLLGSARPSGGDVPAR